MNMAFKDKTYHNVYASYPNWNYPEYTDSWVGIWGVNDSQDSFIVLDGKDIPWKSNGTNFFAVQDYATLSYSELKSIADARRMSEKKLRKKAELVEYLTKWDLHFSNTTPKR